MSKLYFKYGTMNASKSANLLATAHNYEEYGNEILCMITEAEDRTGEGVITSRPIKEKRSAVVINKDTNMINIFLEANKEKNIKCILIDGAQFLTEAQVIQLAQIVDIMGVPVICYGLLKDFQSNLFEGSLALIKFADKLEEIKTICVFCEKKAHMVLRYVNNKLVKTGQQIITDNKKEVKYVSACRYHWFNAPIILEQKEDN